MLLMQGAVSLRFLAAVRHRSVPSCSRQAAPCHFGACCLDVRTLAFCQLMGFPIKPQTVKLLAGEQNATEVRPPSPPLFDRLSELQPLAETLWQNAVKSVRGEDGEVIRRRLGLGGPWVWSLPSGRLHLLAPRLWFFVGRRHEPPTRVLHFAAHCVPEMMGSLSSSLLSAMDGARDVSFLWCSRQIS